MDRALKHISLEQIDKSFESEIFPAIDTEFVLGEK